MGEMTARWVAMLVALVLVAVLALALLARTPLSQGGVGTELVGTWERVRMPSDPTLGLYLLELDSDQHYTTNGPMIDGQGTWEVVRPGLLRLDTKYVTSTWRYAVSGNTLVMFSVQGHDRVRFRRVRTG